MNQQASQRRESVTLLTREQARALTDRVLKMSTADQTRVTVTSSW